MALETAEKVDETLPAELRPLYRANGALLMAFEAMTSGPSDEFRYWARQAVERWRGIVAALPSLTAILRGARRLISAPDEPGTRGTTRTAPLRGKRGKRCRSSLRYRPAHRASRRRPAGGPRCSLWRGAHSVDGLVGAQRVAGRARASLRRAGERYELLLRTRFRIDLAVVNDVLRELGEDELPL